MPGGVVVEPESLSDSSESDSSVERGPEELPEDDLSGTPAPSAAPDSAPQASSFAPQAASSKRAFPTRRAYTRGDAGDADDVENDQEAFRDLEASKLSVAGRYAHDCRYRGWTSRAAARGMAPLPITKDKLVLAAALLRKGGYRSAALYLISMRREHVASGARWTDALLLEWRDCLRAVRRGLGPPRLARHPGHGQECRGP